MSKPNRYRTDKDDDRETEPSRKGHHGLALLILILLAGVVVWLWLARDPEAREEFSNRMANLRESAINLAADLMSRTTTPPSPPDVGAVAGNSLPGAPPKYRSPIETPAELDEALAEQRPVQPGGNDIFSNVTCGVSSAAVYLCGVLPMRGARTIKSCASPLSTIWLHGSFPTMSPQRPRAGAEGFPQACREQISVMEWG